MKRLWILLVALLTATAASAALLDDMVTLERAYVPVLALTNQTGKEKESANAMRRFDAAWVAFRASASARAEATLTPVLDGAEKHIADARRQIAAGTLKSAHDSLEHLRHTLWHWRMRSGMAYFPDLLTAYHDPMEHTADAATHASDRGKLSHSLKLARARWEDVTRAQFDAKLHGFDAAKVSRMKALMTREAEALESLERLGPNGDASALAGAAKSLKGTFAQIYFLFGDFGE